MRRSKSRIGFLGASAEPINKETRQDRTARVLERKERLISSRGVVSPWPPCLIIWEDAQMNNQWEPVHELKVPLAPVITRGFLIHRDEEKVVVALSVCEDKHAEVGGSFTIPMGCVLHMSVEGQSNDDDELDSSVDAVGSEFPSGSDDDSTTPEDSDDSGRRP